MKKYLFLTTLAFLSIKNIAQVKILFDNTKAESAGNADWVVDADIRNLYFTNTGSITLTGTESNAQRFQTPSQAGISGTTAETYWAGALSAWAVDLVNAGYVIESLPYNVPITYGNIGNPQDLSNYKVYIVCEPNLVYTSAEKTAIINFVKNGGGLFMVSDHDISDRNNDGWDSPHIWNDLMQNNLVQNNPFGITFDYVNISPTSTAVVTNLNDSLTHGPGGTVTQVKWSNGTTMSLNSSQNSSVKGDVFTAAPATGTANVLVAHANFFQGKVAAIGDSSPCDDGSGDPNDVLYNGYFADAGGNHQKLLINTVIWLAGSTGTLTSNKENFLNNSPVVIYPNPAFNFLNVIAKEPVKSIEIYSSLGQKINHDINNSQIDISNLNAGCYTIKIYTEKAFFYKIFIKSN